MNKMNKKGFTLIEMLVVIAIIAVLVSIVIPVVGNSTAKAAAATNAANLRATLAQVTIEQMNNPGKYEASKTHALTAPTAKEIKGVVADTDVPSIVVDAEGNITNIFFKEATYDIEYFAEYAATGKAPGSGT